METQNIVVTVEGQSGSGKSVILQLITKALLESGIECSFVLKDHGLRTDDKHKAALEGIKSRGTHVYVTEKQTGSKSLYSTSGIRNNLTYNYGNEPHSIQLLSVSYFMAQVNPAERLINSNPVRRGVNSAIQGAGSDMLNEALLFAAKNGGFVE